MSERATPRTGGRREDLRTCSSRGLLASFFPRQTQRARTKDGGHGSIFRQEEEEGQEEGLQRQPGGHRGGHQQHARVSGLALLGWPTTFCARSVLTHNLFRLGWRGRVVSSRGRNDVETERSALGSGYVYAKAFLPFVGVVRVFGHCHDYLRPYNLSL